MGKYEPLQQFLSEMNAPSLRLNFRDIEAMIGVELPKSAAEYEAWWSNNENGHSHARSWLRAGWRTAGVDLAKRSVTFERQPGAARTLKRDPFGCMAGTIKIMPGVDLTAPGDEVWNAEAGILCVE